MSAQAVIPLELESATLTAGEADNVYGLLLAGDYLYCCTKSYALGPAKLIKIKKDDLTNRTAITFANDGNHINATAMVYVQSTDRIYVIFPNGSRIFVSSVNPSTMAVVDLINDDANSSAVSAFNSLATDGTYLYVLATVDGTPSVVRYAISGLARSDVELTGYSVGNSLAYINGVIYLTGRQGASSTRRLLQIATSTFNSFSTTDFPSAVAGASSADFLAAAGTTYLFVGFEDHQGKLYRLTVSGLTFTEHTIGLTGSDHAGLNSDGTYIWDLLEDGRAVRLTTDLQELYYTLSPATGFMTDLVSDGAYLFVTTFQSSTGVYRFLIPRTAPGSTIWSSIMGGAGADYWNAVACDSNGNVIVCGSVNGYIIINKYSSAGAMLWTKQYGTGAGVGVVCDASGNVYFTGFYNGAGNFGGGVLSGTGFADIFVVKLNSSGDYVWQKGFVGSTDDQGKAIAIDSSGNLYVTGFFYSAVNFGGTTLTSAGGSDIFLLKLQGSDGSTMWVKRFGEAQDAENEVGHGVAVAPDGNVYITGQFGNSITFGGDSLTSAGLDVFLAKFDSEGDHIWSKRFGGVSRDTGHAVAVDPTTGAVVIVGLFRGTINFGGVDINSNGLDDIFVAKLDAEGGHVWSKGLGGPYPDVAYGVVVDNSGNIYVTGRFAGVLDCGNGVMTPEQPNDCFVVKFSSTGIAIWVRYWGGESTDEGRDIALDRSVGPNDILVAGYWFDRGVVDFGDGIIRHGAAGDAFLVKLKG